VGLSHFLYYRLSVLYAVEVASSEPSGHLPNRVAIIGFVPRTGAISALGPLSRRALDDGVLWGTVSQPKYKAK